jgi:hypothetical protein
MPWLIVKQATCGSRCRHCMIVERKTKSMQMITLPGGRRCEMAEVPCPTTGPMLSGDTLLGRRMAGV